MSADAPHFIGIGAQKAGTTWLYRNLQEHPEVWLPPEKELHYFDEKRIARRSLVGRVFGRTVEGARWRRQLRRHARGALRGTSFAELRWLGRYFLLGWDDGWYASLFAPGHGRSTGEVTPSYAILESEHVAGIRELLPEAKIVFLLRNPIERAWSHAMMEVRNTGASEADRDDFLRHFEEPRSRLRTDYARTIEVWASHYPADQIFVGFLEDIHFHPEELLTRVCRFLGVAPLDRWPNAASRVYGGSGATIPGELAVALAELYRAPLHELASRFGGYASWWRFCAEHLVDERPTGGVPAQLFTSPLWDAWLAGRGNMPPAPQSAPLSELALSQRTA